MIDDITLVQRIDDKLQPRLWAVVQGEQILRRSRFDRRLRKEVEIAVVRMRGCILTLCDETRLVELRISIPRAFGQWTGPSYNFPLVRADEIRFLNLRSISTFIAHSLGFRQEKLDPVRFVGLAKWPVKKIAYAVDARLGDPDDVYPTILALTRIHRAHQGEHQVWGPPGKRNAVQFAGGDRYRAMFYAKEDEVRARIRKLKKAGVEFGEVTRDFRAEVAEQARGVVRFEVSLLGVTRIRQVLGWPAPMMPTFELMVRREVGDFVLAQELRRLRLHDLASLSPDKDGDIIDVTRAVLEATAKFNTSTGAKNSRRTRISPVRALAMAQLYLLAGRLPLEAIARAAHDGDALGLSTLRDLERDLRAVRLPRLGGRTMVSHGLLHELVGLIRQEMGSFPEQLDLSPDTVEEEGLSVDAPWMTNYVFEDEPGISFDDDDLEGELRRLQQEDEAP